MALEESEALTHIEALQEHENDEIYKAAYEFISKYFSGGVSILLTSHLLIFELHCIQISANSNL